MKVSGLSFLNGRVTGSHDLVKNKLVHAASASNRWSSSEYGQAYAWGVNFSNGYFGYYNKYSSTVVRAVCAFDSLRGVLSTPSQKTELTDDELIALLKQRNYKGEITKTFKL